MQVVVDGLATNYVKSGDGKTILLLHGWGDTSATFRQLSEELNKNFQTLALDLPGFGATQRPEDSWDLDDYASFISDWLKKIEADSPYAIIGHSNGGAIAVHGLASGKLQAKKLVLLASSGIRIPRTALKITAKVGKAVTAPLPALLKTKLRKRFYAGIDSEIFLFPEMEQTFRKLVSHDILQEAKKIKAPTLIIYGENDQATPASYGEKFQSAIKNSNLKKIEHASHFVHLDQPTKVNQMISEFLTK